MALTDEERQSIVNAVILAIRTNSRTIEELTPVVSLADSDNLEVSGGKRITYSLLKELITGPSKEELDALKIETKRLTAKIGAANGIAPLGDDRKVPLVYLPNGSVIEFEGFVADAELSDVMGEMRPLSGTVVFDTVRRVFLRAVHKAGTVTNMQGDFDYYTDWLMNDRYGTPTAEGVVPAQGKLYVSRGRRAVYFFDGAVMVQVGMCPRDVEDAIKERVKDSANTERARNTKRAQQLEAGHGPGRVLHRGVMPLYAKPYTYYVCKAGERPKFKLPKGYAREFWAEQAISFSVPRSLQGHITEVEYGMSCGKDCTSEDFEIHNDSNIYDADQNKGYVTVITQRNTGFLITPGLVLVTDLGTEDHDRVMFYDRSGQLRLAKRTAQDRYPEPVLPDNFLSRLRAGGSNIVSWQKRMAQRRLPKCGFVVYKKKQCGKEGKEGKSGTWFIGREHGPKYWGKTTCLKYGVHRVCYVTKKGYCSRCAVVTVGWNAYNKQVIREIKT